MVPTGYDHIWDCCCDHGFLGTHLLKEQSADNIHFVDSVPELIENLENKLQQFHPNLKSNWQTHCLNVAKLPIEKYKGKQLIIIAGIGGDLMTRLIDAIHEKHNKLEIDYLLCPVHRQFALREKLIKLNFSLKDETLIEDNKRFYEILFVSTATNKNAQINPIGDKIWLADNANEFLNKTLNYYQRMQQGKSNNVDHIIAAYGAVKL